MYYLLKKKRYQRCPQRSGRCSKSPRQDQCSVGCEKARPGTSGKAASRRKPCCRRSTPQTLQCGHDSNWFPECRGRPKMNKNTTTDPSCGDYSCFQKVALVLNGFQVQLAAYREVGNERNAQWEEYSKNKAGHVGLLIAAVAPDHQETDQHDKGSSRGSRRRKVAGWRAQD